MLVCAISADGAPLGAGNFSGVRDANQLHGKFFARAELGRKVFQFFRRDCFADIDHCRQAHVGFVVAVAADGFVVAHTRKRRFDFVSCGFEGGGQKAFDDSPHRVGLGIGHFQVNLGELGLAIGAKVFVAEAAHDLKILVEAGDHKNLFEHLRRLRQGIETARLDPARDRIVARTFRRGAGHERGFDFEEALRG